MPVRITPSAAGAVHFADRGGHDVDARHVQRVLGVGLQTDFHLAAARAQAQLLAGRRDDRHPGAQHHPARRPSTTSIALAAFRRSASGRVKPGGMCCTMTIGIGKFLGMLRDDAARARPGRRSTSPARRTRSARGARSRAAAWAAAARRGAGAARSTPAAAAPKAGRGRRSNAPRRPKVCTLLTKSFFDFNDVDVRRVGLGDEVDARPISSARSVVSAPFARQRAAP